MKSISLAVAGTDTAQGKMFLEKLQENENIEIAQLYPLEKVPDDYDAVRFRQKNYIKEKLDDFDFSKVDTAVFFCSPKNAREPVLSALEAGCRVVDATGGEPVCDEYIMMIPQINGSRVSDPECSYIVSPSAGVISCVSAVWEIANNYGIQYLNVTALESVSVAGHEAVKELAGQAVALLNGKPPVMKNFPAQVAFNVVPSADQQCDGDEILNETERQYSRHEREQIKGIEQFVSGIDGYVTYNSYTVPLFYGYCAHLTFRTSVTVNLPEIRHLISKSVINDYIPSETVTPVTHGVDRSRQVVTRLRSCTGAEDEYSMFVVMDNLLTGCVSNCIGIIENMMKDW
jgi:aspartate-semialdehyde dehydrogenase